MRIVYHYATFLFYIIIYVDTSAHLKIVIHRQLPPSHHIYVGLYIPFEALNIPFKYINIMADVVEIFKTVTKLYSPLLFVNI